MKTNRSLRSTNCFLFILVLTLSADVETNPGPDYPCGTCGKNVIDTDPAILCDNCNIWFHIQCEDFNETNYSNLVSSNQSFSWLCTVCESINHSSSNSSLSSHESENSFSFLSNPPVSPTIPNPAPNKKSNVKNLMSSLKVMTINFQSIVNKKLEFHTLLDCEKPDIVLAPSHGLHQTTQIAKSFPRT